MCFTKENKGKANWSSHGLVLDTWQSISFCKFDGPQTRNVIIKVLRD
ncbi:MAG: YjbQ family protein [Deltaproteobacteria bacterium]|nr:YjbQ family protein [Smithella sp.]NMC96227.1 YjbQ family protein [Deltaproteobacteria bacterium]